jgi:hypothetical protein
MTAQAHIDSEALIREITRYLAAVDAFRSEQCEPSWRPELVPSEAFVNAASSVDAASQHLS